MVEKIIENADDLNFDEMMENSDMVLVLGASFKENKIDIALGKKKPETEITSREMAVVLEGGVEAIADKFESVTDKIEVELTVAKLLINHVNDLAVKERAVKEGEKILTINVNGGQEL